MTKFISILFFKKFTHNLLEIFFKLLLVVYQSHLRYSLNNGFLFILDKKLK
jgi:hypothetical protein